MITINKLHVSIGWDLNMDLVMDIDDDMVETLNSDKETYSEMIATDMNSLMDEWIDVVIKGQIESIKSNPSRENDKFNLSTENMYYQIYLEENDDGEE